MIKLIVFISFLSFAIANAQEQEDRKFHHQIGVSGSTISGIGISYHYIFSDNYRVKFTGFYYHEGASRNESDYDYTIVDLGIEGQKTIYKTNRTRLYGFLGAGYDIEKDEEAYYQRYSYPRTVIRYSGGGGAGFELLAAERVAFSLNIGLAYSYTGWRYFSNTSATTYRSEVSFGIGGGLSFGYQF